MSDQQRKALPIVAAAAALLLIVVIFVVSRSSDNNKKSTAPSTAGAAQNSSSSSASSSPSGGSSSGGSSGGSGTAKPKQKDRQWSTNLVGAPKPFEGADVPPGQTLAPGIYLWEGFDGWRIRVVRGDGIDRVIGTVTSTDKGGYDKVEIQKVINVDASVAKADNRQLAFNFPPSTAPVVGVDFFFQFYTDQVQVQFNGDNGPIDPKQIHTGANGDQAPSNPLTFQKK